MTIRIERCTILGVGLIGGSLAAAGKRAGALAHVTGVGRGRVNLQTALAQGLADDVTSDLRAGVAGADLVVVAAPVETSLTLLAEVAAAAPAHCVLTDVGSVKSAVCERAHSLGLEERFVGGHPMAGSTATGAGAADADLFRGRVVVLTPGADTSAEATALVRGLWRAVGAEVVEMSAEIHDRVVAYSSHLPQLVASALAAAASRAPEPEAFRRLVAAGFRDTTRIAASDEEVWAQIVALNRAHLTEAVAAFDRVWDELRRALAAGDDAALREVLAAARRFKRELPS